MMRYYLNGRFVADSEAMVHVSDHGFLYGDGCFEGVAIYGGKALYLDEHIHRLLLSARALRIEVSETHETIAGLMLETARRNSMYAPESGYLRPLLTRGKGPVGVKFSDKLEGPTFAILAQFGERRPAYGDDVKVLSATVTGMVRPSISAVDPRVKSNNYLPSVLAYLEGHSRGADIGIMLDSEGYLSEGHAMNLFVVRDGELLTPPENAALAGITRGRLLEIASSLGHSCREARLTVYDVLSADEVFVTGSMTGLAAVGQIDGQALLEKAPGPVTCELRKAYISEALERGTPIPE